LDADGLLQLRTAFAYPLRVALLLGIEQALVVLARELAVDRQPYRLVAFAAAGQAHGEVHHLRAVRAHPHPARVLRGGEDLLEDVAELHLAPGAARLDVG